MENPLSRSHEGDGRTGLIGPILLLWSVALIVGASFFLDIGKSGSVFGGNYLVVAALLTGAIIIAPTYYEYRKGRFDLFHPLTFAAWSYLFPAFTVGGLVLAFGFNQPYFLSFIDYPEYTLPLTLGYISLGFVSLCAGFYLPISIRAANYVDSRLPVWEWGYPGVWVGGVLLLLMGFGLNIVGFISGLLGFQRVDKTGAFDALIVFLALFFLEGTILLWIAFFGRREGKPLASYLLLVVLIALIPVRFLFLGSRAELVSAMMIIAVAYQFSGRKVTRKHVFVFGSLLVVALAVGVIWATTFRNVKGSEARISSGDYVGQMVATADYLTRTDVDTVARDNFGALLERIETVSQVAVVVSNYEKLAPYEEAYGIKDNIVNDAMTSLAPRFLWAEKPPLSDPRAYGDLYFNYSDNSFAMTPFADLLRNFGPLGVIGGMLLVGLYLRIIYSSLVLTERPSMWKKMAYLPLLTVISYEAFFSIFIPSILRVLFVVVIAVLLLQALIGRHKIKA